MARTANNSASNYLSSARAAITGYPFTMACWCRPTVVNTARSYLLGVWRTSTSYDGFGLFVVYLGDSGYQGGLASRVSGTAAYTGGGYLNKTAPWMLVIGIGVSATQREAYFAGADEDVFSVVTTNSTTAATPVGIGSTYMGAVKNGSNGNVVLPFDGLISQAAIWNATLTSQERLSLLRAGPWALGGVRSDALLSWYLNNQDVLTEVDRGPNQNDLTLTGTLAFDANQPRYFPVVIPQFTVKSIPHNYSETINESVGGTDAVSRVVDFVRTQDDAVGVTDASTFATSASSCIPTMRGITWVNRSFNGTMLGVTQYPVAFVTQERNLDTTPTPTQAGGKNMVLGPAYVPETPFRDVMRGTGHGLGSSIQRTINDVVGVTDSVSELEEVTDGIPYDRTETEAAGISDEISYHLNVVINEAVGASDEMLPTQTFTRTINESVAIADVEVNPLAIYRTIDDQADVTDDANPQLKVFGFEEAVGVTDSLSVVVSYVRTVDESADVSDTMGRVGSFVRAFSESVGVTDDAARTVDFVRTLNDPSEQPVAFSSMARVCTFTRTQDDGVGVTDVLTSLVSFVRVISDAVGGEDDVSTVSDFFRTIENVVNGSDAMGRVCEFSRTLSDLLTGEGITDAVDRVVNYARQVDESAGVTDLMDRLCVFLRTQGDGVALTDVVSKVSAFLRTFEDPAEQPMVLSTMSRVASYVRTQTEAVGVTDVLTQVIQYFRSIVESVGVEDAIARTARYARTLADTEGLTDEQTSKVGAGLAAVTFSVVIDRVLESSVVGDRVIDSTITGTGVFDNEVTE